MAKKFIEWYNRNVHPTACPKCGGKVVPIVYGLPLPATEEKADRGELIIGGCCIALDEHGKQISPQYGCIDCGERF